MGKYETAVPLGRGAMGEVFKAFDPALQRFVALKYLRWADGAMADRLLREARLQARVDHELVCKVYEVGVDEGRPFIAMQYIDGRTLEDAAPTLSLREKLGVVRDVARAVHAAHETGLIHRDLKPQNILVEPRAEGGIKPYVLDFGLAREREAPGLSESGTIVGTPAYMAPEQARGEREGLDRRTDVYGLGAVLYRLVSGRPPFEGGDLDVAMRVAYSDPEPPRRLAPDLPASVEAIVLKCLEKDPGRRYPTARALAEDLERFLAGQPVFARAPGWTRRLAGRLGRNRAATGVAAVAVVLLAALSALALRGRWDERERAAAAMRLGQEAAQIEGGLRQAYLLPLHDTRPETALVRERMRVIEGELQGLGPRAEGPGRYALGRAYLALHRYEQAQAELERAWRAGYQAGEVAQALGQALGARYQRALEQVQRIPDRALREARGAHIEKAFREPAFAYLQKAVGSPSTPIYIQALANFYAGRDAEAMEKARRAYGEVPAFYEARVLEGDVLRVQAQRHYSHSEYPQAIAAYESALAVYSGAVEIARSDALVYGRVCESNLGLHEARTRMGLPAQDAFAAALAACDTALKADPESAEAHATRSAVLWRLGEDPLQGREERIRLLGEARQSADQAIRLDPADPAGYMAKGIAANILADIELEAGKDPRAQLAEAIASHEAAVRLDPEAVQVYQNLGNGHASLGQYLRQHGEDPRSAFALAVQMYRKATDLSPGYAAGYTNQGIAQKEAALFEVDQGRDPGPLLEQAMASYRKALESNPRYFFAMANLCNATVLMAERELLAGRDPAALLAEGRRTCHAASELNPRQAFGIDLFLGHAEVVAARWAAARGASPEPAFRDAETALRRSVSGNAELSETRQWLAELFRRRAEWRLAAGRPVGDEVRHGLEAGKQAFALDPTDARALAIQGVLHSIEARQARSTAARASATSEALGDLRRALGMNPLLRREFGPLLAELEAAPGVAAADARR
jgi:tetratricopeptide (TPR) repeat protein/predicted Ser/Thr protein kinase